MSRRLPAALAAITAVLVCVGAPSVAAASRRPRLVTVRVDATYTEHAEQFDGFACSGFSTFGPSCEDTVRGDSKWTGVISADVPFTCSSDVVHEITPDGKLTYTCADFVHGTIRGCGTGSAVIDDEDGYIDFSRYDAATSTAPGFNRWTIRRGSGSAGLSGIVSGSGVNHWTEHVDGEVDTSRYAGTGRFTGTITCYAR